jgi:cytochrome oxidase Cu insertion factor (SCO1/SenC/PrrC family)
MQRKRRGNALLLSVLFLVLFIAGCEKIAGVKRIKRMEINKPAPDFVLHDAEGKIWKLSSLQGKVVFLHLCCFSC